MARRYHLPRISKYHKTAASDGTIVYGKKMDITKTAKDIINAKTDVPTEIKSLKDELSEKVEYRRKISSQALDPKKKVETGDQHKGRMEDLKFINKEINEIINALKFYGVKVRRDALVRDKIVYEGGHETMFTTEDIKKMKLEVFEEHAEGKVSDELRDYMLITLESVGNEASRIEAYTEAVESIVAEQRDKYVEFVLESHKVGLISDMQKQVMLEMAEDDFMFEAPTPDMLPELVASFLEAAKEGDEDKKAAVKEQIEVAKELKAVEDGAKDEVVTEGADCSIVEKLESLKVKLSDEEKAMAERFDEMIAKASAKEEKKEEPKEDPKTEEGAEETPVKEEPKTEEPKEEKPVKESTCDTIANSFSGITLESSMSEEDIDGLKAYVAEAVADDIYSAEDKARIEKVLNMR